jgi:hypothetical protein
VSDALLDRLAAFGTHLRDEQVPITLREVLGDERPIPPVHLADDRRPNGTRPQAVAWLALAAVAAVTVGLSWLASGTDDIAPTDSPPAVVPTVVEPETTLPGSGVSETTPEPTGGPSTTEASPPTAGAVPESSPVQLAPDLSAPDPGATQKSIIGDITWTRVGGPLSSIDDVDAAQSSVEFALDGVFYGSIFQIAGPLHATSWWTSADGVDWERFEGVPDRPSGVHLTAVDGTMWAQTREHWPNSESAASLYRWDGTAFQPVALPTSEPVPGEGLVVRASTSTVVAGLEGEWVVVRQESFGVPWADLLGIEPPFEAGQTTKSWTGAFDVHEARCSHDFDTGSCGFPGETWRIRPEMIDTDPVRFDLYDAATDELITSVVPPADLLADLGAEQVLDDLGQYNYVGGRTESFVVSAEGTARPLTVPFRPETTSDGYVGFDGQVYTLGEHGAEGQQLWATSDLDNWDTVALPGGINVDSVQQIISDGSTLVLSSWPSATYWTTTDGRTWTGHASAVEAPWLESADFGWMETDRLAWSSRGVAPRGTPTLSVSPDGVTWQRVPVPLPTAVADIGATWADATEQPINEDDDPALLWNWDASAHGDAIFVVLRSLTNQEERWVGRVQAP